jgi:hypothetical protein
LHQIQDVFCYLVNSVGKIFTEETAESNGTKIYYFDYEKIPELKTAVITGNISPSYIYISNYFSGIKKDIKLFDTRINRSNNIIPLLKQLDLDVKKIQMDDENFVISVYYPADEKQKEIIKKYTNYDFINRVHFTLNGVSVKDKYFKDIFENLSSLQSKIYINIEIKNKPDFFKQIIMTSREEFLETNEVRDFFKKIQSMIINNDFLKKLNDEISLKDDAQSQKDLSNMLNTLINESKENNSEEIIKSEKVEKDSFTSAKPENKNSEPIENITKPLLKLDDKIIKITIPKNKTFYEMKENFYVHTNVKKMINDTAKDKIIFNFDHNIKSIDFVESKEGKIKYCVSFANEYCDSEVLAIFNDDIKSNAAV